MVKICIEKIAGEGIFVVFSRLKNWGVKGGLAILDQGVYSGSNFIFNILLARWLSTENYGAFSLAFAIYLFFTGFHNALILEPMSVFGTAKYSENIESYLAGQFTIHAIITGVLGIFILLVGYALFYFALVDLFLSHAVIGVGFFLPIMLLMWFARRAFYILGEPGRAFFLSAIYSVCLLGGAFYLHFMKIECAIVWFGIMGLSSLTGLIILLRLDVINFSSDKNSKLVWGKLLAEQWTFGRWIVLAAFFYFAATQIQIFIAAGMLSLNAAGAFRALQNFILPMMQVLSAISTLALPSVAFAFGRQNYTDMRRKSFIVTSVLIVFSALYASFLFFFAGHLETLLYAGRYENYIGLIPILGIIPFITSMEIGFSLIVRSLRRPIYYTVLTLGMAVAGVVSGLFLIPSFGVAGAVGSLIASATLSFTINIWFYRKWYSSVSSLSFVQ
jgi:O-antigen/teichoic acid export membrane protein